MKLLNRRTSVHGGTVANAIFFVLALGLCGLCTFQFKKEGELRQTLEGLSQTNAAVTGEREEARKEAGRWKKEVSEVEARSASSEALNRSNLAEIGSLKTLLGKATNEAAASIRSRDAFKDRLEEQAAITRKASEAMVKLKTEAEAEIKRIAAIAEERTATANKYAKDYRELAEACEKLRLELQGKAAAPAK